MFKFLRGRPGGMDSIDRTVGEMLIDCRHTFDLAMAALEAGEDISGLAADVRATDERINAAEEQVRRQLIVHVAVHGGDDVGAVLADLLVVKKLERIGDQHKNILDLAEEGVRLGGAADHEEFEELRREVSEMFATTAAIVADADGDRALALGQRAAVMRSDLDGRIRELIHTDLPGSHAVPRVLLLRYLKRIVANLAGVAMTVRDGIERTERDPSGEDVTDD